MFEFRLINTQDGNQVIDRTLKTPYESLTDIQMIEYNKVDSDLFNVDRIKQKERREIENRKKKMRNPLFKIAAMCGAV